MGTRENKCIDGEINLDDKIREKQKKNEQKKKMHKKDVTSNMNLKLSVFIFLVMAILALVIILYKGRIGGVSLVYVNESDIHTAELECDNYFLSTIDNEATRCYFNNRWKYKKRWIYSKIFR